MQKQCDIDAVNADGYPKETGLAVQVFKKYPSSLSRGSECNDFFKMYHKHVQTESDDDLESFGTSGLLSLLSTKKEVVVVPERGDQYRVSTSKVSFNLMFFSQYNSLDIKFISIFKPQKQRAGSLLAIENLADVEMGKE
jgi:hypothetical protein